MRVMLEFSVKKNEFPTDYRRIMVSWLKYLLSRVHEGKYFKKYYHDTVQKPYTFSMIFKNPVFKKDIIYFTDNKIKVLFSMMDEKMEGYIFNMAFLEMKDVDFQLPMGNSMKLIGVSRIKEKLITEDRAVFRTAPGGVVLIRDHNRDNKDKFYTVEDENYKEKLNEYLKNQCLMAGFTENEVSKVTVNTVCGKKVVVKNYNSYVDGVVGSFDISAPSYILQYFYTLGLGAKKSLGFSTVNLL